MLFYCIGLLDGGKTPPKIGFFLCVGWIVISQVEEEGKSKNAQYSKGSS